MARPRIEVDWDQVDKLCGIQCTKEEIAGFLDISEDTLERRIKEKHGVSFAVYYGQKSQSGKISLRRKQFQIAQNGNVTMLIWLGKQYLGQSEKKEIDLTDRISGIKFED